MDMLPHRKRNRLDGDLYRMPGAYFITICTLGRKNLFWNDASAEPSHGLSLSASGLIVEEEIKSFTEGYDSSLRMKKYVVMPNHIHMLLMLESSMTHTCPDIRYAVRFFKRRVSQRVGASIWQKGFHDHIVRNDQEFREIWKYIDENPIKWHLDRYYSDCDTFTRETGDEGIAPTP